MSIMCADSVSDNTSSESLELVTRQRDALLNAVRAFMAEAVSVCCSTRRQIDYALLLASDDPGERAKLRPPNFEELPLSEQWRIDRQLGILDWDGKFGLPRGMTPDGKYGLYDTGRGTRSWVGNTDGPLRYEDEETAKVAALIFNRMVGFPLTRVRAQEFDDGKLLTKVETIEPKMTPEQALADLEEGEAL